MTRVLLLLALGACSAPSYANEQPISFDHALHMTLDLDGASLRCVDCHVGAERSEHAGLPSLRSCLRCHMRPQSGVPNSREARVRELAAAGDFRWVQVTRNPGHVYAPHRAHVGIAKMDCSECHGDVASWRSPPREPNQQLVSMSACISCHRERGAPTTCGTCHR